MFFPIKVYSTMLHPTLISKTGPGLLLKTVFPLQKVPVCSSLIMTKHHSQLTISYSALCDRLLYTTKNVMWTCVLCPQTMCSCARVLVCVNFNLKSLFSIWQLAPHPLDPPNTTAEPKLWKCVFLGWRPKPKRRFSTFITGPRNSL